MDRTNSMKRTTFLTLPFSSYSVVKTGVSCKDQGHEISRESVTNSARTTNKGRDGKGTLCQHV